MGIGPGGSRGSPGPHLPLRLFSSEWKRKKTKKVKMARKKKDGPQGGPDVATAKEGDEEAAVTAAARGHPLDGLLELQAATSYHNVAGRWEVCGWGLRALFAYCHQWFHSAPPSLIAFPNMVLLHHRPSQWPDLRTPAPSAFRLHTVALLQGSSGSIIRQELLRSQHPPGWPALRPRRARSRCGGRAGACCPRPRHCPQSHLPRMVCPRQGPGPRRSHPRSCSPCRGA